MIKTKIVENNISDVDRKADLICYNFTREIFGSGDDMRDWMNEGDFWVDIEELEIQSNNKIKIWFERGTNNE